ncbi:hypothetical protein BDC45DRAFT_508756, partial [Circinella umbellata]
MDSLFNLLRVVAKKRILEGIIPLSSSLYIPKGKDYHLFCYTMQQNDRTSRSRSRGMRPENLTHSVS